MKKQIYAIPVALLVTFGSNAVLAADGIRAMYRIADDSAMKRSVSEAYAGKNAQSASNISKQKITYNIDEYNATTHVAGDSNNITSTGTSISNNVQVGDNNNGVNVNTDANASTNGDTSAQTVSTSPLIIK